MKFNCEECGTPVSPSTPISALGDKAVGPCCALTKKEAPISDDPKVIDIFRSFFKGLKWAEYSPGAMGFSVPPFDQSHYKFWNNHMRGPRCYVIQVNPSTLEWKSFNSGIIGGSGFGFNSAGFDKLDCAGTSFSSLIDYIKSKPANTI